MAGANLSEINEPNRWRLETPGHSGWKRTARPDDPDKYLMVSADCHCNEPSNLWVERIDRKYRDRLPRIEVDENGVKWTISEGWALAPARQQPGRRGPSALKSGRRSRAAIERSDPRRCRRRSNLPQQGPHDVGDQRRRFCARAMPSLQRLGVGGLREVQRSHVAARRDCDGRPAGLD